MDCKASAIDCRTNCVSPFGGCSAGCLVGCSASDEITFGVGRKFAWPNPAGKGNAFASEFIPHDGLIGDAFLEGERTSGGREGDEAHGGGGEERRQEIASQAYSGPRRRAARARSKKRRRAS